MRLVLHLGAHGTDGGQIATWIARNREGFEQQGVAVPPPRLFLSSLSEALDKGRNLDPESREEALLRGLGASGQRRWMVVSAPGLLGPASGVLAPEGFYVRDVARRLHGLHSLFPRCAITLLLAVRRPSGIIPALLPDDPDDQAEALTALDGEALPWARLVASMRRHLPGARVVIWQHEDFGRVWPRVLAELTGPGRGLPPVGLMEFAAADLSAEARLRVGRYLAANPPAGAGHLAQICEAFGRRYGRTTTTGTEALTPLPGWMRQHLQRLDGGQATEWADAAGQAGVLALT